MQWQITVSAAAGRTITDNEFDAITESLASNAAAVGALPGDPTGLSVVLAVDAGTLRAAVDTGLRLVIGSASTAGVQVRATAVEGLTWEAAEARVEEPLVPELVGLTEIAELLSVSKQRASQLAAEHASFPRPAQTIAAGKLWPRSSVEKWASTWERRRTGRPRNAAPQPSS
jgi:hypothetical protein